MMGSAHGSAHVRRYRQTLPIKPRQQLFVRTCCCSLCVYLRMFCVPSSPRSGRDDMYDDDRYGPVGGFGGRHPGDLHDRYGHAPPGAGRFGPGPERYSYEHDDRDRRGGFGGPPEDGEFRAGWREREAGPGYEPRGYRGEGGRPGYEPRGGFDRERYEAHRPGYEAGYAERDLLPPPPPPRFAAAGPVVPEAVAEEPAVLLRADDSDSEEDPERAAFEAELARVAADMERVSRFLVLRWVAGVCSGSVVVCVVTI